jgi:phage gpG-like protein
MSQPKFNLDIVQKKFDNMKRTLPKKVGNMSTRFFTQSFAKEGFTDQSFTKWPDRKKKEATQRNLLVKSGRLRRAVSDSLKTTDWNNISFIVPLRYAAIHNHGGTVDKRSRTAILHFKYKGKDRDPGEEIRFSKRRGAHFGRKVQIGAHSVNIPQRQFMGKSITLQRMIYGEIMVELKKIKP